MLFFLFTQLKEVVLKSGKVLRADACVIGAGDVKDDAKCTFFQICPHYLQRHVITADDETPF